MAPAIARAISPSLNSCSSKPSVNVWTGVRAGTLSQGRDRAGVDAAGQEDADRNVGDQVPRDAVLHDVPELRLVDRRSVLGARDAPVRRASHRAGGLDRAPLAGTEQLDAFDRGDRSHDEPVPEDRPDRPAIQAGMFEEARRQESTGPRTRTSVTTPRAGQGCGRCRAA